VWVGVRPGHAKPVGSTMRGYRLRSGRLSWNGRKMDGRKMFRTVASAGMVGCSAAARSPASFVESTVASVTNHVLQSAVGHVSAATKLWPEDLLSYRGSGDPGRESDPRPRARWRALLPCTPNRQSPLYPEYPTKDCQESAFATRDAGGSRTHLKPGCSRLPCRLAPAS
jgi:hypothetical protein